jgi:hypothetical protein
MAELPAPAGTTPAWDRGVATPRVLPAHLLSSGSDQHVFAKALITVLIDPMIRASAICAACRCRRDPV